MKARIGIRPTIDGRWGGIRGRLGSTDNGNGECRERAD